MASVFFGSDFANPDTYQKFWSDIQMFTTTMTQPDPQTFMEQFTTGQIAQKANKWASRNLVRWSNAEYDAAFKAAQNELDPVKRAALFIKMNDLVVSDGHVIPLFGRPRPRGHRSTSSVGPISAWDNLTAFMDIGTGRLDPRRSASDASPRPRRGSAVQGAAGAWRSPLRSG